MTSLAERLGFGPDDRVLIINCDDLGSCHAANVGTYESLREGIATSATLMVPCPSQPCRMPLLGVPSRRLYMTREVPGRAPPSYRPKWFGEVLPLSTPLSVTSTTKAEALNWDWVKPLEVSQARYPGAEGEVPVMLPATI